MNTQLKQSAHILTEIACRLGIQCESVISNNNDYLTITIDNPSAFTTYSSRYLVVLFSSVSDFCRITAYEPTFRGHRVVVSTRYGKQLTHETFDCRFDTRDYL